MSENLDTAAFILHTRAFKETSLIVEAYTLSHGRVNLLAKGVRSASKKNNRKALLQLFQPVVLNWLGRSELKTLTLLEGNGLPFKLLGMNNLCGLYLNELMLKLLLPWDPNPELFFHYQQSIELLESKEQKAQIVLREFELFVLEQLGYGCDWNCDIDGLLIEDDINYVYLLEQGFSTQNIKGGQSLLIKGELIKAVAAGQWEQSGALALARKICRNSIDQIIGGKQLNSRKLLQQTLALQAR